MTIKGKVMKGAQRGKDLGYPTANIPVSKKIEEGIYLSKVHSSSFGVRSPKGKKWYPALTFVGAAQTFGEKKVKAESFLLDFSGDLYEKTITIELLKKIRDNQKFDSPESLIEQMNKDVLAAREFFGQ